MSNDGDERNADWPGLIERHESAVSGYLKIAWSVQPDDWRSPVNEGKWTPAQITEHLILTYVITIRQIRGGAGIKPHYNFLIRPILRLAFLSRILRSGQLPAGAKAPEEIQPADTGESREDALAKLEALASEFACAIYDRRDDPRATVSHHVFGELDLRRALELAAVHTNGHARQLPVGEDVKSSIL